MQNTPTTPTLADKLAQYHPSAETIALLRETPIVLMVGISAAGKDTIIKELMKTGSYYNTVSYTSRAPRGSEQEGVDYYYTSLDTIEPMLDDGAFVEGNIFGTTFYGTPASEIQRAKDAGKIAITDMDVNGVARCMKMAPQIRPIFVVPPDYGVWQARFVARYEGNVDQADYQKRIRINLDELTHALETPYFLFVVNDQLEDAVAEVDALAHGKTPEHQDDARRVVQHIIDELRATLKA